MQSKVTIDINKIMEILPHRYPFLLIDRILEIDGTDKIIALKNVTINENFFVGHFPNKPVMPGVLIIEAMAQAAVVLVAQACDPDVLKSKLVYFMSIEKAHFRKPVLPGDSLHLHIQKNISKANVWKMSGEAFVDGIRVADAIFSAIMLDRQ